MGICMRRVHACLGEAECPSGDDAAVTGAAVRRTLGSRVAYAVSSRRVASRAA